jgi:hypothetical protein
MAMHPNFESRSASDVDAALAAVMAVLRVMLEKQQIDLDRVHQLVTTLTGDDVAHRARARWLVDYMAGTFDAEGQRP